jgi:NAD-dependent dihydropyrimidine dehydrogenase PreA subunit
MTLAIGVIFWPTYVLTLMGLIFGVYLYGFVFWGFFPEERRWRRTLTIGASLTIVPLALGIWLDWPWTDTLLWTGTVIGVVLLMAMDGCGSSPLYKGTVMHWLKHGDYQALFDPVVDPAMCTNCMACVLVCPMGVFAARRDSVRSVVSVDPKSCIECMACVKQCHFDAIFSRSGAYKGDVKSVPMLDVLLTRNWSHLKSEDRWLGQPTTVRNGIPIVVENVPKHEASTSGERTRA